MGKQPRKRASAPVASVSKADSGGAGRGGAGGDRRARDGDSAVAGSVANGFGDAGNKSAGAAGADGEGEDAAAGEPGLLRAIGDSASLLTDFIGLASSSSSNGGGGGGGVGSGGGGGFDQQALLSPINADELDGGPGGADVPADSVLSWQGRRRLAHELAQAQAHAHRAVAAAAAPSAQGGAPPANAPVLATAGLGAGAFPVPVHGALPLRPESLGPNAPLCSLQPPAGSSPDSSLAALSGASSSGSSSPTSGSSLSSTTLQLAHNLMLFNSMLAKPGSDQLDQLPLPAAAGPPPSDLLTPAQAALSLLPDPAIVAGPAIAFPGAAGGVDLSTAVPPPTVPSSAVLGTQSDLPPVPQTMPYSAAAFAYSSARPIGPGSGPFAGAGLAKRARHGHAPTWHHDDLDHGHVHGHGYGHGHGHDHYHQGPGFLGAPGQASGQDFDAVPRYPQRAEPMQPSPHVHFGPLPPILPLPLPQLEYSDRYPYSGETHYEYYQLQPDETYPFHYSLEEPREPTHREPYRRPDQEQQGRYLPHEHHQHREGYHPHSHQRDELLQRHDGYRKQQMHRPPPLSQEQPAPQLAQQPAPFPQRPPQQKQKKQQQQRQQNSPREQQHSLQETPPVQRRLHPQLYIKGEPHLIYNMPPTPLSTEPSAMSIDGGNQKTDSDDSLDQMGEIRCEWTYPHICTRSFNDTEGLYEHICNDHIGRRITNNLCLVCYWKGCSFTRNKRDHLTSHVKVHITMKPFKCRTCKRRFKRPQDLNKHVRTHYVMGDHFKQMSMASSVPSHAIEGYMSDPGLEDLRQLVDQHEEDDELCVRSKNRRIFVARFARRVRRHRAALAVHLANDTQLPTTLPIWLK
nr:hypothetical protein HK105_003934 [Polyrhizophydium stewartii]